MFIFLPNFRWIFHDDSKSKKLLQNWWDQTPSVLTRFFTFWVIVKNSSKIREKNKQKLDPINHLQTLLQARRFSSSSSSSSLFTFSYIFFLLLPSPLHPYGFFFYIFWGFPANFLLLSWRKNKKGNWLNIEKFRYTR